MRTVIVIRLLLSFLTALRMSYFALDDETKARTPIEVKTWVCGMDQETFAFFSSVVEAESDRGQSNEGRILIALTILNRVESDNWPSSISGVITQSGQFTVYYAGIYKSVGRTSLSDMAIVEAWKWKQEEHPNVIYFNSIGFFPGYEPYKYADGNYFSLGG